MYYYFYINICKITWKYYFWVHKTKNINDWYIWSWIYKWTSYLKRLKRNTKFINHINKYWRDCFLKWKIFFSSYEECLKMESCIVTSKKIKEKKCLNTALWWWILPYNLWRKASEETRQKHRDRYKSYWYKNLIKTKERELTSPDWIVHNIDNLRKFSRDNSLSACCMAKVCAWKQTQHKWRTWTNQSWDWYKKVPHADRTKTNRLQRSFKKDWIIYNVLWLESFYKEKWLNWSRMRALSRWVIKIYKWREVV